MKTKFLSEEFMPPDPMEQFSVWFAQAAGRVKQEPNAMCLATTGLDGRPSARIVLLREVSFKGLVFYTNYLSRKGQELDANPYVAATFHWKELARQVRIRGKVRRVSRKESEAYFQSRPLESRISATISPQSEVISDRTFLETRRKEFSLLPEDSENILCPENWGGYRIIPDEIEFWQEREHRLHDRILYTRKGTRWIKQRLAP